MDLSTNYMGIKLKNPLVASASPLSENPANFRRMEDAGISAIVKHSLFEEQLTCEIRELNYHLTQGTESFAESLTYFPEMSQFVLGPEEYLDHIAKAKKMVDIPVIASLNGCSQGGWIKYAKWIEEAGADALELNIYMIPTNHEMTSVSVEEHYCKIVRSVRESIQIPIAVKISPFFSSLANMARRLEDAGADALVMFNRFYQPDINLETLEVQPNILLSTPHALRLPLRWIAILYGRLKISLAATGGVHQAEEVLKLLMAGADVTMLCSVLLKNGIDHAKVILQEIQEWMEQHEYESVKQMQGSMSQKSCANPGAFERWHYMKALQSYHQPIPGQ